MFLVSCKWKLRGIPKILVDKGITVKNPARVSEELLISATENAKTKAEILCKASGNALGQLLNIDYNLSLIHI